MKSGWAARKRRPRAEEGDAAAKKVCGPGAGMVNFCPQCGQKVEEMFHFCPACGGRLPVQEDEPMQITPSPSLKELNQGIQVELPPLPDKKKVQIVFPKKEMSSTSFKVSPQSSTTSISPKAKARLTSERSPKHKYTLKLDAKEGKLFNEQNFLQRAAKKVTVEKWKKQHLMPFLGIPECVGFGVHENSYRFLVFPELGRSLQSILDDNKNKMTEKAVMQLAVRLLDVLEYLHENEYTHGDLSAENIYVNPSDLTVVTLADFSFAFRYSPGGKHVPQRDCSRTPHEGTLEFISLDSHRGAAPSRRSDLESLGYCLVKWLCGALPWSAELTDPCDVTEEKERCKADIIKSSRLSSGWGTLPAFRKLNMKRNEEQEGSQESNSLEYLHIGTVGNIDCVCVCFLSPIFNREGKWFSWKCLLGFCCDLLQAKELSRGII
ncbi:inactive serine/threonine-protein kinase VRK3 isoform X3 [Ahaetulla prasina]|uniref:inactive serine/threonine-protein kinase VRK3 isoform X3 n=1 Tax=Ahaetulla prasina TaxID=499056 RepID=UPI00264A4C76|nr:inactive serine/threonine-protein kinase VRK3 isoform X3 [Ahaetulla prasina]